MNNKFKNPYFWLSIIGVIFGASGVDINTLTSWPLLLESLKSIVYNPICMLAVFTALLGVWNDNSSPGMDTIKMKK